MALDRYMLMKEDDEWKLKQEGAERAHKNFDTKEAALDYAKDYFGEDRPASLRIRKADGTIQEERTYPRSADPKSSKG